MNASQLSIVTNKPLPAYEEYTRYICIKLLMSNHVMTIMLIIFSRVSRAISPSTFWLFSTVMITTVSTVGKIFCT